MFVDSKHGTKYMIGTVCGVISGISEFTGFGVQGLTIQ